MKERHFIVKAIAQFIFFIGRLLLSLRYKVVMVNTDSIDKKRPVLFLPNHQAVVDPMILVSHIYPYKNIVPVVTSTYYDLPILNRFFKNWGAVRVSDIERGSRNVNVLNDISTAVKTAFNYQRSIVIYPSGQIAEQGFEKILNKKAAYQIVSELPGNVQVVGVKIKGLWGSRWSKAWTGKPPAFASNVLKGMLMCLANFLFFMPRRKVEISFEDITERCKKEVVDSRKSFNQYLEKFYNSKGVEKPLFLKGFFYTTSLKRKLPSSLLNEPSEKEGLHVIPESFPLAITKGVNKIINKKLERGEVDVSKEDHLVNDLGADSLSLVEIISEIESEFKVSSDVEISVFTNVKHLYALANGNLQENKILPDCSFGRRAPFYDFIKIKNLDSIPKQFIKRSSSHKGLPVFYDAVMGESTRGEFFLKACVVAEIIKKKCKADHVGIMLPALQSTSLLIVSTYLAGKVPVMLNWTVGNKVLEHCVKEASVEHVFTATSFVEKIKDQLPQSIHSKLIMMEKEVAKASVVTKIIGLVKSKFPKALRIRQELDDTAVILFTSGSENLPKAVPLTHGNIVHDLSSTLTTVDFSRNEKLMAILPPFHSFGFTVLSILPLITGVRTAYYPDPTDGKGIVAMIKQTSASLLVVAPSFLKIILSNANSDELSSVKYVVSGAEALSSDLKKLFQEMLPKALLIEGYGITECAPVLSLNPLQKQKDRSVGQVIKDVDCKILDLETNEILSPNQEGMICFRGENIFKGYLNKSIESPFIQIHKEWYYKTGDLGYLDNENYLFITGRLKRFIKIAGEMISLPSIEQILLENFGSEDEITVAVEGSDKSSAPQIVLFTIKNISIKEANDCLRKNNAPPIAKISRVEILPEIPVLGTGKVNYKLLKDKVENEGG